MKENQQNNIENWEEEFRNKWEGVNTGEHNAISTPVMDEIISDISKLLSSQKEELEKQWLEKYGDLTKQFDEMVKWKDGVERKINYINISEYKEMDGINAVDRLKADILTIIKSK